MDDNIQPQNKLEDMLHELKQPINVAKIICQSILQDIQKNRLKVEDLDNDLSEIVSQMNRMSEIIASYAQKKLKERK